jgi:AcrR family transcriptional regulator
VVALSGRDSILRAAGEVFAESGFSGASISEIAARAGVAKSLIYHHFQSKEQLWHAVIGEYSRSSMLLERFHDSLAEQDLESLDGLARGEEGLFAFLGRHPELIRMMSWLNLEGGLDRDFPDRTGRERVISRIRQLQEKGVIRSDVDPVALPILYIIACFGWYGSRWKYSRWFSDDAAGNDSPEGIDRRFIGSVMDIILNGIAPRDD